MTSIVEHIETIIKQKINTLEEFTVVDSEVQIIQDHDIALPVVTFGQMQERFQPNDSDEFETLSYTVEGSVPILLFASIDISRVDFQRLIAKIKNALVFDFQPSLGIEGPILVSVERNLDGTGDRLFRTATLDLKFQWSEGRGNANGSSPNPVIKF